MITETWQFTDKVYCSVDVDRFYYPQLRRTIDIGWDELESMIHTWIGALNLVSAKIFIYKNKLSNKLQLNQNTFNLLQLTHNKYYDIFDKKLKHYSIEIITEIDDNTINVCLDNQINGKILIQTQK